jgi:hypothetical protein
MANFPMRTTLVLLVVSLAGPGAALACPFCTALQPTLSQRREAAAVVALGELAKRDGDKAVIRLHEVLKGQSRLGDRRQLELETKADVKAGSLVLLLGEAESAKAPLQWSLVSMNELSYAYFARAPSPRTETAKRLRYFAPYLEHADVLVAEDAYQEFGHAGFDEVAAVADALDQTKLRTWLRDANVPEARKGFYGMALGLATSEDDRRQNERLLRKLIEEPAPDVRAGFDGMLGGYLLLAGEKAVELIEQRYLANSKAAVGDVRHTMTALRFYYEYGRGIPRERLRAALRHLLGRPEFAASAIVDLARWQDWDSLESVVAVFGRPTSDAAAKRAVVGYLLVCPDDKAAQHLERLRRSDPKTIAEAEKSLSLLGGGAR